ncbi:MAG: hypothetical protein ILNGONEN_01125 [Syntrophorhabdaceae bacterium]|nr:hypothetical protein [Syntrophorhabdaceae bacterium]
MNPQNTASSRTKASNQQLTSIVVGLLIGVVNSYALVQFSHESSNLNDNNFLQISSTASRDADIDSGLVAYYPFNGNANDESGHGNNGTVVGATLTTDRLGKSNSAYSFDGVGDYISTSLTPNRIFSISIWYNKHDVQNNNAGLLSTYSGGFNYSGVYYAMNGGGDWIRCDGNSLDGFSTPALIWKHIVIVSDGVRVKVYENTSKKLDFSGTTNHSNRLVIGDSRYNGRYFTGKIDDIRVYNRALTEEEVRELYEDKNINIPKKPMLSFPSNEATNISNDPTLKWNSVSGADTYRLQVSTVPDFSMMYVDEKAILDTSRTVGPLINATKYYWRVNATNAFGTGEWSDVWSFMIFGETDKEIDSFFFCMRTSIAQGGIVLENGVDYKIEIDGTYSVWTPFTSACGNPESAPRYTCGGANQLVGWDPEFVFAAPSGHNLCSGLPSKHTNIELNLGNGWFDPMPVAQNYDPEHRYIYKIRGLGQILNVRFLDNAYGDNYGALKIRVLTSAPQPDPPQNLDAVLIANRVTLTWSHNSEPDLLLYRVYRNIESPANILLDTVSAGTNTYVDSTDIDNNRVYFYRITAVDNDLNESAFSNEVSTFVPKFPDLEVPQVQTPPVAWSGQEMEVSWVVNNTGTEGTQTPGWHDRVYLSSHADFNAGDLTVLGTYVNFSYLNAGEGYKNAATFTLPRGISGTYYIHVRTDIDNKLTESDEQNNNGRSNGVQVNLTPSPDLQVTNIIAPDEAFSGDTIRVTWTVQNKGNGVTETDKWFDTVFFSNNRIFDFIFTNIPNTLRIDEKSLGALRHTGVLKPDSSYTAAMDVILPHAIFDDYYLFVYTDIPNQRFVPEDGDVYEFNQNLNNTRIDSIRITLKPPPDLVVTAVNIPQIASFGQTINVQWAVQNQGPGAPFETSWSDAIYLSSSTVFDRGSAVSLGTFSGSAPLDPDSSYTRTGAVKIPGGFSGQNYIFVEADFGNRVFEHTFEDNNVFKNAQAIIINNPDLVVAEVNIPANASSGKSIEVTWRVRNQGAGTLFNGTWSDRIYLSDTPVFNRATATALGSFSRSGSVEMDSSYIMRRIMVLPNGISGDYYVFVETDWEDRVYEHLFENNNTLGSAVLPVVLSPWPDLQVATINDVDTLTAGDRISVTWMIRNAGVDTATGASWTDRVMLSPGTTFDPIRAILLASVPRTKKLDPGQTYTQSRTATLRADLSGTYCINVHTDFDNDVYEHTDEGNNIGHGSAFHIRPHPPVDLAVTGFTAPASGNSGQLLSIQWAIENLGKGTTLTSNWQDKVYLSADVLLNPAEDILIVTENRSGVLKAGERYVRDRSIILPNGISGNFFAILQNDAGNQVNDTNRSNNTVVSPSPIAISLTPSPDLQVTALSASASVQSGQPNTVHWTISNTGAGPTPETNWYEAVYLSANPTLDNSDTRLGTFSRRGALAAQDSYADSLEVDIPVFASGDYFLIFKTDNRDDVYEHNGEGNNTAAVAITAVQPLPADLVVMNITIPTNAMPGENVTITWTLENRGQYRATGRLRDAVYVSADTTWQLDDPLIGVLEHTIDIPSGGSQLLKMQINLAQAFKADTQGNITETLPGVVPGAYHAIIRTNIRNNIRESDISNNDIVSEETMMTDIPVLELGVPVEGMLVEGQMQYYRVEVPREGKTLRILFDSAEEDAINELYLRFGDVPNKIKFDYRHDNHFHADQRITVPFTRAGTYYLLVHNTNFDQNSLQYSLTAQIVEFGIESIDLHDGGQGGNVTIGITGASFGPHVEAFLNRGNSNFKAKELFWVNATEVYVTFELTELPLGIYNVGVKQDESYLMFTGDSLNPVHLVKDSSYSIQENAFSIVQSNYTPLDISVNAPFQLRAGQKFELMVQLTNRANNDIPSPLLAVHSLPSIKTIIQNIEDSGTRRVLAVSRTGPAGILRPGKTSELIVTGFAPTNASLLKFRLNHLANSDFDFNLNNELRQIDVPIHDIIWQKAAESLLAEVKNEWKDFEGVLSKAANDQFERNSDVFDYATIVRKALINKIQYNLFPSTENSLDSLNLNSVSKENRNEYAEGTGDPDCSRNTLLYQYTTLTATSEAMFALGAPTASRHLFKFINLFNQPIDYKPYDYPARLLYDVNGVFRNYNQVRFEVEERVIEDINNKILNYIELNGTDNSILIEDYVLPSIPSDKLDYNPTGGIIFLDTIIELITKFGARRTDLWLAFGGFQSTQISIQHINAKFFSEKCEIRWDALIEFRLGDNYEFGPDDATKLFLLDYARNLDLCGWARPFTTSITMFEDAHGGVRVRNEICCPNDIDCDGKKNSEDDDVDGDGKKNGEDDDVDDDGKKNGEDDDVDGDGKKNGEDDDVDGDGKKNGEDDDVDGDGKKNGEDGDIDGDGIPNGKDPDIDGDGIPNEDDPDMDGDGIPNDEDPDMDGDGIPNSDDPEPSGPDSGGPGADIPIGQPRDPNDIFGPVGFGDRRWITKTQTLPYTIRFENDSIQATASAQVVRISQQLDGALDPRSFRLGSFGFSNFIFQVPENSAFYTQRLDLTDSLGLFVDVNAGIDINSNRIFWTFTSIDPATGELPQFTGFLPVNDASHRGEGFVNYTIRPKSDNRTGDIVHAKASIVFDINAPVETPEIFNTIDAGIPNSRVAALPSTIDSTTFTLSWSGMDDPTGSRIRDFTLYVSADQKPFEPFEQAITDTSLVFSGDFGGTYRFFTIVRDNAGNVEALKTTPEATVTLNPTTSVSGNKAELPKVFELHQNYPNPFNPITTIKYDLPVPSEVKLEIFDILGRRVRTLVDGKQQAGFHSAQWDGKTTAGWQVATGLYFYRLEAKGFVKTRKMLLLR